MPLPIVAAAIGLLGKPGTLSKIGSVVGGIFKGKKRRQAEAAAKAAEAKAIAEASRPRTLWQMLFG